ncbi:RHS repeat-associated core domain-containing protein [Lewinella sp. LCG006]|uniref:RHS repeat-associated core domain-containing protein n=1 Tax=Lewinella sp. LCG006 TaxID=3231911 RepID=UPI00345FFA98
MLFLILVVLTSATFFPFHLSAQMIGGTSTGQMSPKEAQAGSIISGGVSGDVNMFTGTFNASYDLGSVSTLSGMSFSLSMSYNSTFATGDNVPALSGVPYGEGWSLNVPTISVSTEDYNKYSAQARRNMGGGRRPVYFSDEAQKEGDLYWFEPMMNIPGVGGGRMVLKRTTNQGHIFVLNKFEKYIEAIFDGKNWQVILDDGTRYEFSPLVKAHREASNQRVHPQDANCSPDYNAGYAGTSSLVMPKTEYLSWYCTRIWHPDLIGSINFSYNLYGEEIDFFKRYKQDIHRDARDFIDDVDINPHELPKVYRDVHLSYIQSSYERLLLDYSVIDLIGSNGLLDPNDPAVTRVDDLYSKKMVYNNQGSDFTDWYRYRHIKSVNANYNISGQNPYLWVGGQTDNCGQSASAPQGAYYVENAQNGLIDHSFLESPRLSPFNSGRGSGNLVNNLEMPPGEIYEVKASISGGNQAALFDLNISSGDFSILHDMPTGNQGIWLPACKYADTRGHAIHSTFDKAVKWHVSDGVNAQISEFFVLPNNPIDYAGFSIQIGPANSDNNYAATPLDVWVSGLEAPFPTKSYFNWGIGLSDDDLSIALYGLPGQHNGEDSGISVIEPQIGLFPTDRISNNFGIGLPWHNMLDFYEISDRLRLKMCPEQSAPHFWWNTTFPHYNYPSQPTLADEDYSLSSIEVWRYSKVPLMLTGVTKQNFIGTEITSFDPDNQSAGWETVASLNLRYNIDTVAITNTIIQNGLPVNESTGYFRNIVRLDKIIVSPTLLIGGEDETTYPTTHFEYENMSHLVKLNDVFSNYFFTQGDLKQSNYFKVLSQIVNPLGQITEVHYQSVDNDSGSSYAIPKYLGTQGLAYVPPTFYNTPVPLSGGTYKAPGYAFQVNMIVKDKMVHQKGGEIATWKYSFSDAAAVNDRVPLIPNLRQSNPNRNRQLGFGRASVSGPNSATLKTDYVHSTNWLLWGKLKETRSYDNDGNLLSETIIDYDSCVAFEPVQLRIAPRFYEDPLNHIYAYYDYAEISNRPDLPSSIYQQNQPDGSNGYTQYYEQIINLFKSIAGDPSPQCEPGYDDYLQDLSSTCYTLLFERPANDPLGPMLNECLENIAFYDPDSDEYSACNELFICYNEYLSLRPNCSNAIFYDDTALPPNISGNDGGEFETPYFYLGQRKFFEYVIGIDPSSLYSYFIKKTTETSTSFDRSCDLADGGFTNITNYEYYDADYRGQVTTEGFDKMGITANQDNQLEWEPSWQLYKVEQTSPSVPSWGHTEEYFYIYDLINHPQYQDADTKKPKRGMLRQIFDVKKRRDLVYEKRVTRTGSGGGSNIHSTFYVYEDDWEPTAISSKIYTLDGLFGDGSCENDGTIGGNPYLTCTTSPPNNQDFCQLPGSNLYCPCTVIDETPTSSGITQNSASDGFDDGGGVDPGDVEAYLVNFIQGNIYLKETYIQTAAASSSSTLATFPDPDDFSIVDFACPVLKTHTILSRNNLGQVVMEEDEKGLKTRVNYGTITTVEYDYCFAGQIYRQSQNISSYPGLPKSITVGAELPPERFPLTTAYEYHPSRQVRQITDPNGIRLDFDYDGFNRLIRKKRNGDLIQSIDYNNWPNNHNYTFTQRALKNFVAVTDFTESEEGTTNTQYIDPLGRNVYTTSDGGGSNPLVTDNYFDIYGRVFLAGPPTGSLPDFFDADTGLTDLCDGMNYKLDVAPRNRPLVAAKNDLCLTSDPNVIYEYCIATGEDIILDHIENGGSADDFGTPPTGGGNLLRTKITDEDGKVVIEYTNGVGQKIATLGGGIGGVIYTYDEFGNVSRTINAEQQETEYFYNYLGLLRLKKTVDEGETRYYYNPSGQMIALETSEHGQMWGYDEFGRMTQQVNAGGIEDESGQGLPWVEPTATMSTENHDLVVMADYINLLATSDPEKEWYYNEAANDPVLNEGLESYIGEMGGLNGKVAQTISYDGEDPIESRLLTYNEDGFLGWEVVRYLGFSSDLKYQLSYPKYNLQGSYYEQQVNLNCDGNIDFNYLYKYDGRNRIRNVGIDYPSLGVFNAAIASYTYHPSYLSVSKKALHDYEFGVGCTEENVDVVVYDYDTRQRMKSVVSDLFVENLVYDGDNYNGNIDAVTFEYELDRFEGVPLIFSGNTAYQYQYDGMNRLTSADASVGFDLIDAHLYTGDFDDFGDVTYQYDRVGNLTKMSRGILDHDLKKIGFENLIYDLVNGTNKLGRLRYTGLDGIEQEYAYGYNGIGCMTSDEKRGMAGIDYVRGVYPTGVGSSAYLYDVNDMRIAKSGQDKEYYLRDAAGKELAIFNSDQGLSWYIHGNERVAKIAADKCGESLCRPKKPECSPETQQQQSAQLAAIPYVYDPNAIVYPNLLVRVQFCDGKDRYLLFEELKLVDGPYNILQQIVLTEPNAVLGVALNDNPVEAMLLEQFFFVRENAETLNVNNYQACAVFCPGEVYTCSEETSNNQLLHLNNLHDALAGNISNLVFPDKLHRMRMCNGVEVYLLEQQLASFPGFGMILQTFEIGALQEEFIVSVNGGEAYTITGTQLVSSYLAETNAEIRLEGYAPCYEDLPCDPSLPDCSLADALNGGPNLSFLYDAIANTTSLPTGSTFPLEMFRLRFCDGQEYYVLASEIPLIASSNYTLLQHLFIPSIGTLVNAKTTANENTNLTITQLLEARANDQLLSLLGYESCGQVAECEGPICSPAETEQQTVILDQLEAGFGSFDPATLTYPNTIYRFRFCEGREMYFVREELSMLPSGRVMQQEIEVNSPTDIIDLVNIQGQTDPGTLSDFINMRGANQLYTIGSFVPCRYRQQRCRTPEAGECGPAEIADQLVILDQIKNTNVFANQLSYPLELKRVALCNGREVYLLEEEIALMPHTIAVLETVPVNAAFTPEFQLWVYDGGIEEQKNFAYILSQRFNDAHTDFRILGFNCEAVRKDGDTNCEYDIYLTDLSFDAVLNDPTSININATFDWERYCDDNSTQGVQGVVVTNESIKSCVFMEYRFDLANMGSDDLFYIDRLGFSTRNPDGRLVVDLNPATVLSTYPNLAYTADNGIINCDDFISACPDVPDANDFFLSLDENTEPCCTQYMNVLNSTLDHAQGNWADSHGGTTQGSPFFVEFDPVGKILSIKVAIQHYLSDPYINIDHLLPEATGYIKGAPGLKIDASVHKVLSGCNIGVDMNVCDESQYIDLSSLLPDELPLDANDIDEWYSLEEQILCCGGSGLSQSGSGSWCCTNGPLLVGTVSCVDYGWELECDPPEVYHCVDGICEGCPTPTDLTCEPEDIEPTRQALAQVDVALASATAASYTYPTVLYQLFFCGDERRYLFQEELGLVSNLSYEVRQRIIVETPLDEFRVTFTDGSAAISSINQILAYRKEQRLARVDPLPDLGPPPGDDTPNDPGNETELFTTGGEQDLQISYYLYDHLGNTRIVFHTVLDCKGEVEYVAEYVADYYPFGKILREWVACDQERYLTTYHERDIESGYDYRGARFYDSDLGRFLSVDPLANIYPAWSTYAYVLDNPIIFIDPDGREVVLAKKNTEGDEIDWSKVTNELEQLTGLKLSIGANGKLMYSIPDGMLHGSATARKMLIDAISSTDVISVMNDPLDESRVFMNGSTKSRRNTININFDQIKSFVDGTSQDLNPLTYGYGMNFLHELGHTETMGAMLDVNAKKEDFAAANVDNVNKIRKEMSKSTGSDFGRRVDYRSGISLTDPGFQYQIFSHHARRKLNQHRTPERGYVKHKPFTILRAELIKDRQ